MNGVYVRVCVNVVAICLADLLVIWHSGDKIVLFMPIMIFASFVCIQWYDCCIRYVPIVNYICHINHCIFSAVTISSSFLSYWQCELYQCALTFFNRFVSHIRTHNVNSRPIKLKPIHSVSYTHTHTHEIECKTLYTIHVAWNVSSFVFRLEYLQFSFHSNVALPFSTAFEMFTHEQHINTFCTKLYWIQKSRAKGIAMMAEPKRSFARMYNTNREFNRHFKHWQKRKKKTRKKSHQTIWTNRFVKSAENQKQLKRSGSCIRFGFHAIMLIFRF